MSDEDDRAARALAVGLVMDRVAKERSTEGLRATVTSMVREGERTRVRVLVTEPLSGYVSSYNARTGEPLGWFFDRVMVGLDVGALESECLSNAREAAAPPEGAELVSWGYEETGGAPVYVARWRHLHHGIPVEGDAIVVKVNGRTAEPFSLHRRWHGVSEDPKER